MNDELLRKIAASTGAFNKAKSITDMARAFAPLSAVQLAAQRSLSDITFQNPTLDVITKSSLALKAKYFEPVKFNPAMAAFESITQMIHKMQFHQPVYNPLTIPKWIFHLNRPNNALNGAFMTQSNWLKAFPIVPEDSAVRNAMGIISGLTGLNAVSRNMADITKISESILRFDVSVNNLYKFINDVDEDDDYFQIDIDSQLTAALSYDIENANSEENKMVIPYVMQYFLDTFTTMCENYKSGKDKELFVKWITDFLDNLKGAGARVTVIKFLVCIMPLLYSIKKMLKEDEVSNKTTYITESTFEIVTTTVKYLKENPDNRYKIKFTIPAGTKLIILQDKGKWIKVKFISHGVFYSGWTLNNNL